MLRKGLNLELPVVGIYRLGFFLLALPLHLCILLVDSEAVYKIFGNSYGPVLCDSARSCHSQTFTPDVCSLTLGGEILDWQCILPSQQKSSRLLVHTYIVRPLHATSELQSSARSECNYSLDPLLCNQPFYLLEQCSSQLQVVRQRRTPVGHCMMASGEE